MPTSKRRSATSRRRGAAPPAEARLGLAPSPNGETAGGGGGGEPETTGRFIVIFKDAAAADVAAIRSALKQEAGLSHVLSSTDYETGAVTAEDMEQNEVIHFNNLGIAVVSSEEAVHALAASASDASSPIMSIEPEYVARLTSRAGTGFDPDYFRGYRDAVNHLYDRFAGAGEGVAEEAEALQDLRDTNEFTWGLQAIRAHTSSRNGQGVKVAILDTGIDLNHPDFVGRSIISETFSGLPVQDVHGHGTHCVGTACGALRPASGVRRYGVATAAQIFVGKVFDNASPRPGAATAHVAAGIEWAITNGCRVVSLSLGVPIDRKLDQYETPIRRALDAGTLVVAAGGNNANRPGLPGFDSTRPATNGFVEPPANADAALAVAAVDSRMRIAAFSARSSQVTGTGGIVNIGGPGVGIFSSVPVNRGRHAFFDGTSMATPHVAGVAALWAQSANLSGIALWNRLLQTALPLSLPSADIGSGLVQAPQ